MRPEREPFSIPPGDSFLVGAALGGQPPYEVEDHLDELHSLVATAGIPARGRSIQRRQRASPATYIGRGKVREVAEEARRLGCGLLVFDDDLTPAQVKNVESEADLAVLDRSAVILEIFRQRARTREARTQVELARLRYLLPRLTGRWIHLSRQVGGIGVRGGAGETQLEADRRMLRQRIRRLERELEKVERTRRVQRGGRRQVRQVALAGYTNAGKSTLFNRLTRGGAHVEDRLFATLDTRLRQGALAPEVTVVFADTVGFIRKLPHHLVASFRGTLGEIALADLVLHVIDRSHPQWEEQQRVAEEVMADLGVRSERVLTVYNKADLVEGRRLPGQPTPWISARTGEGVDGLRRTLAERLGFRLPELEPVGAEREEHR